MLSARNEFYRNSIKSVSGFYFSILGWNTKEIKTQLFKQKKRKQRKEKSLNFVAIYILFLI